MICTLFLDRFASERCSSVFRCIDCSICVQNSRCVKRLIERTAYMETSKSLEKVRQHLACFHGIQLDREVCTFSWCDRRENCSNRCVVPNDYRHIERIENTPADRQNASDWNSSSDTRFDLDDVTIWLFAFATTSNTYIQELHPVSHSSHGLEPVFVGQIRSSMVSTYVSSRDDPWYTGEIHFDFSLLEISNTSFLIRPKMYLPTIAVMEDRTIVWIRKITGTAQSAFNWRVGRCNLSFAYDESSREKISTCINLRTFSILRQDTSASTGREM